MNLLFKISKVKKAIKKGWTALDFEKTTNHCGDEPIKANEFLLGGEKFDAIVNLVQIMRQKWLNKKNYTIKDGLKY